MLTSGGVGGGPPQHAKDRTGRRNAAVFPDPVWAHAMRSLFPIMMGRAYFCTGVGLVYFAICGGKRYERERERKGLNLVYSGKHLRVTHSQASKGFIKWLNTKRC